MATKIQLRGDTLENWLSVDPVLMDREVALVATDSAKPTIYDSKKVGDGKRKFSELPLLGYECLPNIGESPLFPMSQKAICDAIGFQYPVFDEASSYEAGTFVQKDGFIYEFTTLHAGSWDESHVKKSSLKEEFYKNLRIAATDLGTFTTVSAFKNKLDTLYGVDNLGRYVGVVNLQVSKHPFVLQVSTYANFTIQSLFIGCSLQELNSETTVLSLLGDRVYTRRFTGSSVDTQWWDRVADINTDLQTLKASTVYLSESEYAELEKLGKVDPTVEYNIYEDEEEEEETV